MEYVFVVCVTSSIEKIYRPPGKHSVQNHGLLGLLGFLGLLHRSYTNDDPFGGGTNEFDH